jgi:hypothetical protein
MTRRQGVFVQALFKRSVEIPIQHLRSKTMLLLHTPLVLALGLGISTAVVPESFENTTAVSSQEEQPRLLAGRFDRRQRGECGTPPHIWALNLCQTEPFCYADPFSVELWQPKDKRSGYRKDRLVIENTAPGGQQVRIRWQASKATRAWPMSKMPIQSGTAYLITLKKSQGHSLKKIKMYQIPADYNTNAQRAAAWMRWRGCTPQVDMLDNNIPYDG